jgi:mono/diheme cytochrome c family protein
MKKISPQQRREHSDPHENNRPVPNFVLVLAGLLGLYGVGYIFTSNPDSSPQWGDGRTMAELSGGGAAPASGGTSDAINGEALFTARCAACHQASGAGLAGVFPPLAGSEWVQGKDSTLVAIVLNGIVGELTVRSQTYNGVMPPFKDQLTDAEIAAIATYLRGAWGNSSGPIAEQTVAEIRKQTADRAPFQGNAELAASGQ